MKKALKAVALGLTLSLCVAFMGACSDKKSEDTTTTAAESTTEAPATTEAPETTEATTEETYPEGYPVTLTDIYGHESVIKAKPERVVSCSPACTEIIYEIGQGSTLVGRTSVCNFPAEAASVESIGDMYDPDIEKIVSLSPDIVVADSSIFPETAYDQLVALGVNVVIINEGTTLDGVYTKIETFGKIFHADEEAAAVVSDMQAKIAEVQDAIKDVKNHPSVYYVVGFGEGGDWTATGDTFVSDIIEAAGGDNIAKDGQYYMYNVEDLVSQDPNIIILPAWADGVFQQTAPYSELTAVKEGNVVVLPTTDTLDRQCARNADALEMLAKIFYPECFEEEQAA